MIDELCWICTKDPQEQEGFTDDDHCQGYYDACECNCKEDEEE